MTLVALLGVLLIASFAGFVWWLVMLVEAVRIPSTQWQARGENQLLWVLLMVFLGVLGTLLYVLVPRPKLR